MNQRGSPPTQPLLPGDGVVVLDRAGRILGRNQTAQHLLGLPLEPGERFDLEVVFQGPCASEVLSAMDQALSQGRSLEPSPGVIQDCRGHDFNCEYSLDPLYGPSRQITGVILTLRDLDFKFLAEENLPAGDHLPHLPRLGYQTLVESLAEGIFTINTQWRITSFNQRAEQITGYRREEVLGRFCWDIFRSDLCEAGCPLKTTLDTGLTRMDQDVRMLSKDGKRIAVLTNTSVVKDRGDLVVGAVESFRLLSDLEQPSPAPMALGDRFADIIGAGPSMRRLFALLPDVAASEVSVLITGESGTGKELFARAIHARSGRREGPFVAVNCSALAESLLESELFGHEKAAFTGAVRSKVGRFELAKGGTLFLDEIGDLKTELQVKLLRVLEQHVFERVGGTRLIPLDARVIAATNRDLTLAMSQGYFREDLFYRLRTVPLVIPPLRDRREDIEPLVEHFRRRLNKATGKNVRAVDPKVLRICMEYGWPGNVRELERVMEYAFVFVKGPVIFPANLPPLEQESHPVANPSPARPESNHSDNHTSRQEVVQALRNAGGRRQEAAQILGISRTSLWRKMKQLGLS